MENVIFRACPECNGTGSYSEIGCCGNAKEDGSCCGFGIPVQKQCEWCHGDGEIKTTQQ